MWYCPNTQGKLLFVQLNLFWAGNSDIHQQVPMQQTRICIAGMLPSLVFPGDLSNPFNFTASYCSRSFGPEAKTLGGIIVFRAYI